MAVPKVFSSLDSGAPVLSSADLDSAIEVIRACLVTGYGSTVPVGWTEEFTGTNKAVFRNMAGSGATGAYFRVEAFNTARGPFSLTGYSTMSDVDTGTDATQAAYGWRNPSNSSNVHDWFVVATPTAFWFFSGSNNSVHAMFCGAGDIISNSAGDAYRYFVVGARNTGNWNYPPSFLGQGNSGDPGAAGGWNGNVATVNGLSLGRDHFGTSGPIAAGILQPWFQSTTAVVGSASYPSLPSANSANSACMGVHVLHGFGGTAVIRGMLPGVYLPLFNVGPSAVGDVDTAVAGAGSSTRLMKFLTQTVYAGLLVETALNWGD